MAKTTKATEATPTREPIGYRYTGDGANFPGVPARDLAQRDLVRFARAIADYQQAGTLEQLYAPVYQDEVTNG